MGNADFSTISVILGECMASRLVLKEGRTAGCKKWTVESGMGRTVWREREMRLRGVSLGSILRLPGATFSFLLVYTCFLQNIAHSSCPFVHLSRSLDHSELIPQETHLLVVAR